MAHLVISTRGLISRSLLLIGIHRAGAIFKGPGKSAEFSAKDAREMVVLVIVSNYLLVIADQSEVESATSQRDTAKALFQQTSDQKTAGLASAVDVLRSQVQLQSREQKLIVAKNNLAKQKLVLARASVCLWGKRSRSPPGPLPGVDAVESR